jgi:hypothetical protein
MLRVNGGMYNASISLHELLKELLVHSTAAVGVDNRGQVVTKRSQEVTRRTTARLYIKRRTISLEDYKPGSISSSAMG